MILSNALPWRVAGGPARLPAVRVLGFLLLLPAYVLLVLGGFAFSLGVLGRFRPRDLAFLAAGLALGAAGGWLLALALRLAYRPREGPVTPGRVVAVGLFFPGAAQAYGGRWLAAGLVLGAPVLLINGLLAASVLLGLVGQLAPGFARAFGTVPASLMGAVKPFYLLLWVGSLVEGALWARGLEPERASAPMPGWRAGAAGLGAVLFLYLTAMALQVLALGAFLRTGVAAKAAVSKAMGREPTAPAETSSTRDTEKAAEHDRSAELLANTDLARAAGEWEAAVGLDPARAEYRFKLGLAHWKLGRKDAAAPHLKRFLELEPDGARAPHVRKALASLEGEP